jgi:mono/diheme cytochrome c family protein
MLGPLRTLTPLTLAAAVLMPPPGPARVADEFAERVAPVLAAYCFECHEPEDPAGELDLTRFRTELEALAEPELWTAVEFVLSEGEMPPEAASAHPTSADLAPVLDWLRANFEQRTASAADAAAGRTTVRRLNRYEYQNAVLDLFGVDFDTSHVLPADSVGHGFDVLGDVLSMPPLLFEKSFEAAERIAAEAVPLVGQYAEELRVAEDLEVEGGARLLAGPGVISMYSVGTATATFEAPRRGEYIVRIHSAAQQAGPDPARAAIIVDGVEVGRVDVTATTDAAEDYEVRVMLEAGKRRVGARFINDYYMPDDPDPEQRDRNMYLARIGLLGPTDVPLKTPFEARYVHGDELARGTTGARKIIERVASLAWRGPVTRNQVAGLVQLAPARSTVQEQLRVALTAILVSPRFLYRIEPDAQEASRALSGRELATRLAAFLWSSVPDRELLDAAASGALDETAGLADEVDRMLDDARASRLAVAFAGQWLQLRRLDDASPDPQRFPGWSDDLRTSMRRESEAFFEAVLRERRPIAELLSADFTFVDERLARHYDIPGVHGDALQRVQIPAHLRGVRGGILGQAAPLVATSMPTRTSPVVRGKWVLEALLASPPPPPPPGVDSIDASIKDGEAASVREQLEIHRKKRACAVCHEPMDGLGFALENYGPTGAWRETENGEPIDTRAELPGNVRFDGPSGLREVLLRDDAFVRGLALQLATFALGRALTSNDRDAVLRLVDGLPESADLRNLIHALVADDLFRHHRRGDTE